jgi:ankyrin repeat protein
MIELLCDFGADLTDGILDCAISSGNKEIIKCLQQKGAKLDFFSLESAMRTKDLNLIKMFSQIIADASNDEKESCLSWAATYGSFEILQWLITSQPHGPGLVLKSDKNNWSVLHYAVYGNNPEVCQKILESKLVDINCKNVKGETPIELAVGCRRWRVFPCLLKHDATATGKMLNQASENGELEPIQLLVTEYGININYQNDTGNTALDHTSYEVETGW